MLCGKTCNARGQGRRAGGGLGPLCVGKPTMREGPGPPRARRPRLVLCGKARHAQRPGPLRAAALAHFVNSQRARARPPRAAALALYAWEKTKCANGQGRRARGGPGPFCVGKRTLRERQGRRARGGPGLFFFLGGGGGGCAARGGKAAARSAALPHSLQENTPGAKGQGRCLRGKTHRAQGVRPPRARRPCPSLRWTSCGISHTLHVNPIMCAGFLRNPLAFQKSSSPAAPFF